MGCDDLPICYSLFTWTLTFQAWEITSGHSYTARGYADGGVRLPLPCGCGSVNESVVNVVFWCWYPCLCCYDRVLALVSWSWVTVLQMHVFIWVFVKGNYLSQPDLFHVSLRLFIYLFLELGVINYLLHFPTFPRVSCIYWTFASSIHFSASLPSLFKWEKCIYITSSCHQFSVLIWGPESVVIMLVLLYSFIAVH